MASGISIVQCPHHLFGTLIDDWRAGDQICSECGLVVGERVIDLAIEWQTFNNEAHDADTSYAITLLNEVNILDQTLVRALDGISVMANRINLAMTMIDKAYHLFKRVYVCNHIRGRRTYAAESACVYIVCRAKRVPITFKEICAVSKTGKRDIFKHFKLILAAMEISVESFSTSDFMPRFCGILKLPFSVEKMATNIGSRAVQLDTVPGRSAISVSSAAIYLASHASENPLSMFKIGDIAGVAEITIRKSYEFMFPRASDLFPEGYPFDFNQY